MFGRIIESLENSPIVKDYEIHQLIEERSTSFLRVEVNLIDGSHLFIKELLFPDGSKYSYHWQSDDRRLLVRWDNDPHHPEIATHPDHKHIGEEVVSSNRISVEEVLSTIAAQIKVRSNENTQI